MGHLNFCLSTQDDIVHTLTTVLFLNRFNKSCHVLMPTLTPSSTPQAFIKYNILQ